jgi:D-threo-aldose 1-dehydrogenase
MTAPLSYHRDLGGTSLVIPPIVFGTAALANIPRVIAEQAKLSIIGEWLRGLEPPMCVEVAYEQGEGAALEVLGRVLRRHEVAGDDIVIQLSVSKDVSETWEKSCRLLGDMYRPKLIAVQDGNEHDWQAAVELKASGRVRGVGVVASANPVGFEDATAIAPDWITLACGPTIMRHSAEVLAWLRELERQRIPIIASGVFDGGFLVGSNRLDGRVLMPENDSDRSVMAWRKGFVALCEGHGVSPAHVCIQFALALPAVVAVRVGSSYADRVAQNITASLTKIPASFWDSMREEGLLTAELPSLWQA